jgi:peroxiredoxin
MITKRHLAALAATLALGAGGYFMLHTTPKGEAAPQVTYTLLNGSQTSTDQLKGKVVLVNFWATSCTTCVHEMPEVMATYEKFKSRGFETVAVAMSYDPPAYVANFAETRKLPFGVAIDNTGEIAKQFGQVRLTPTTFVIDKQGNIVKRYVGAPDFAQLHTLLDTLLKQA